MNVYKIIGMVATTVVAIVIGFFAGNLIFGEKPSDSDSIAFNDEHQGSGGGGGGIKFSKKKAPSTSEPKVEAEDQEELVAAEDEVLAVDEPKVSEEPVAEEQTNEKTNTVEEPNTPQKSVADPAPQPDPVQSQPTSDAGMPEIIQAYAAARGSTNPNIGVAVSVKAKVENPAHTLRYELYRIGETTPAYSSTNGYFAEVYPVKEGKYLLKVTNVQTNDVAEKEIGGLGYLNKLKKAELQKILYGGSYNPKTFQHYWNIVTPRGGKPNTKNVKVTATYANDYAKEANVDSYEDLMACWSNGFKAEIIGDIVYDKYNRITAINVRVDLQ